MPNFTPNSKIYIGRVPWDNSYRHTRLFGSASAQTTWMQGKCTQALAKENYTYVRMNNSIRVPFNAESLYTYNYVMYQNANYGTKWFYAFIVGVNYINENTTELMLELDLMQTWMFDYSLKQCFVEREHVSDDTWGTHLNPEPSMELEYVYDSFTHEHVTGAYIVLLVNQYPNWNVSQTAVAGSTPVSGEKYQNQFNACKVLIYKGWEASGVAAFKEDMEAFNGAGAAQTICDAFTVPSWSINANDLTNLVVQSGENTITRAHTYTLASGSKPGVVYSQMQRPLSVDGYTPRNNKVLTYPYCYLELGDFSGRKQDLRWEFFEYSNDTRIVNLENRACGISDCIGYITPMDYNGVSNNESSYNSDNWAPEPFTYDFSNKISWVFSAYQNWAAQNAVSNQLAAVGSIAAMNIGVLSGLGGAAGMLGKGSNIAAMHEGLGNINAAQRTREAYGQAAMRDFAGNVNKNMVMGGIAGLGGLVGNIERMRRVPDTAKGNTAGNSKFQNNYSGWYYAFKAIRAEFARIVDGFFDMYGYQVDSVKTPNITCRASWNYVKCQNSCNRGNVPADQMAAINSIYDNGITFWHVDDIGNYSLDNRIAG